MYLAHICLDKCYKNTYKHLNRVQKLPKETE